MLCSPFKDHYVLFLRTIMFWFLKINVVLIFYLFPLLSSKAFLSFRWTRKGEGVKVSSSQGYRKVLRIPPSPKTYFREKTKTRKIKHHWYNGLVICTGIYKRCVSFFRSFKIIFRIFVFSSFLCMIFFHQLNHIFRSH